MRVNGSLRTGMGSYVYLGRYWGMCVRWRRGDVERTRNAARILLLEKACRRASISGGQNCRTIGGSRSSCFVNVYCLVSRKGLCIIHDVGPVLFLSYAYDSCRLSGAQDTHINPNSTTRNSPLRNCE